MAIVKGTSEHIGEVSEPKVYKPRDFDAENRGKTRCQLVAASMPILLTNDTNMEEFKTKINELVEYIFTGE